MAGYAEGIILFNFAADAMLLFATGLISSRSIQWTRLLAASFVGTIPIWVYLVSGTADLWHKLFMLLIPVFMVRIAFQLTGAARLFSMVLTFYFVVFLTGGILFGFRSINMQYAAEGKASIVFFFILSVTISFYFIQRRLFSLGTAKRMASQTVTVSFSICGNNWSGRGLVDTGNALRDPISAKEVAICQIGRTNEWPTELFEDDSSECVNLPGCWTEKLVWIPSKSIHEENRLLAAFRTESFSVEVDGEKRTAERVLVTFTTKILSNDQSFDCLLHPNMIRESIER